MIYMAHVSNTMWRIKNQPSNSTSCSDNALRLLVLVLGKLYWGLQVTSSFSICGCILKGWFGGGTFWKVNSRVKAQIAFEGHWRLQSWTLVARNVQDWSPHTSFTWRALKFQPFSWRARSKPRRQSKNTQTKYNTHINLVHDLYDTCFQYNVKNQESTI